MTKKPKNVRAFAVNNGSKEGFNIYLDFSGQAEFLMFHRHDALLYNLLRDGQPIKELQCLNPQKIFGVSSSSSKNARRRAEHLSRSHRHVNSVIEEFMEFRATECVAS